MFTILLLFIQIISAITYRTNKSPIQFMVINVYLYIIYLCVCVFLKVNRKNKSLINNLKISIMCVFKNDLVPI